MLALKTQTQMRTQTRTQTRPRAGPERLERVKRSVAAAVALLVCVLLGAAALEIRDRRSFLPQVSHASPPLLQPLQPLVQPLQPLVQPLQPLVQPLQPLVQPLQPLVQPIQPLAVPEGLASSGGAPARAHLASSGLLSADRSTIALIGDSWVSANKLDTPLAGSLEALGLRHLQVRSFGHPGAMSKQILKDLLADPADDYSSSPVLRDDSIRHCIVIAGVNDTAGYIGADFYAHHMTAIAETLLERGIRPLIVEVPEYGIEQVPRSAPSHVKAALFRALFDHGEVDVVARYRAELEQSLVRAGLRDRVTLVGFGSVAADYRAALSLYEDPTHLNPTGRSMLADLLASVVARELARESGQPAETLRAERTGPHRESLREASDLREQRADAISVMAYQPSAI